MKANVITVNQARSKEIGEAIDRIMHDRPKKERREFQHHVEIHCLAAHEILWLPRDAQLAKQGNIADDLAQAVRKLGQAGSVCSFDFELIRESLYWNAKQRGATRAEAIAQALAQVTALATISRNAPAIADACKVSGRKRDGKNTPSDILIRDLAHFFAEDFGRRPSKKKNGLFAQLVKEITGESLGNSRLERLTEGVGPTARPPRPGRYTRSTR